MSFIKAEEDGVHLVRRRRPTKRKLILSRSGPTRQVGDDDFFSYEPEHL